MRNVIRYHVTRHDRLVAEGPGARTLRHVSTSPRNSAKLFLSTPFAVYGQNFSVSRVLSLIFFC